MKVALVLLLAAIASLSAVAQPSSLGDLAELPISQEGQIGIPARGFQFESGKALVKEMPIYNLGSEERVFTVEVAKVLPSGELVSTRELIASPAAVSVKAGASGLVKLRLRSLDTETGNLYRLIIKQPPVQTLVNNQVTLLVNFDLPAITQPTNPTRKLEAEGWKLCNRGNIVEHVQGKAGGQGAFLSYLVPGQCIEVPRRETALTTRDGETVKVGG